MRKLFIYLLMIISCGCGSNSSQYNTVEPQILEQVDLINVWDNPQDVMLSSIADSIFYIPLEMKEGSYLGDDIEAVLLQDYLLVYENNKTLRLYDKTGKYLLTYGCQGKGPGEYLQARNFTCDEGKDRVYILDSMGRKIIIYNINGDLVDEIKLKNLASRITVSPTHDIGLLYLSFGNRLDTARLEWISSKGETKQKVPLYKDRLYAKTGTWDNTSLYWINGKLRISEPPFDTIHQLDPDNGFIGSTAFIKGDNAIPREVWFDSKRWRKEYINYKTISWMFECKDYIFFQSIGKYSGRYIYNMLTKEVLKIKSSEHNGQWFFGLQNDLDGGLPFFYPSSSAGRYLIGSTSPFLINKYFEGRSMDSADSKISPELNRRFVKMAKEIKQYDNPIVVVVRMK